MANSETKSWKTAPLSSKVILLVTTCLIIFGLLYIAARDFQEHRTAIHLSRSSTATTTAYVATVAPQAERRQIVDTYEIGYYFNADSIDQTGKDRIPESRFQNADTYKLIYDPANPKYNQLENSYFTPTCAAIAFVSVASMLAVIVAATFYIRAQTRKRGIAFTVAIITMLLSYIALFARDIALI